MTWQLPEALLSADTPLVHIQMSPFDARYLETNHAIAQAVPVRALDWSRHLPGDYAEHVLTANGRTALGRALDDLDLAPDDDVAIVTTTGSPYITACVTREIETRCRWSRTLGARTRAVLVIHEFGFPATLPPAVAEATARGLPVIEDCAWAIGCGGGVGQLGDFVVYSFPKAFPMAFGGLLKARRPLRRASRIAGLPAATEASLRACAGHYLARLAEAIVVRRANYAQYTALIAPAGFRPYFEPSAAAVPHAFIVALDDEARAKRAREILQAQGVRSSVFFGAGGYYLPNHQNMGPCAVELVVRRFLDAWHRAGLPGMREAADGPS